MNLNILANNFVQRNKICSKKIWNKVLFRSTHSEFAMSKRKKEFKLSFIQERKDWCDKVNNLPTIEQRLVELNMPKLYKYTVPYFEDREIPFNGLRFIKFATRTHTEEGLPQHFYSEDNIVDEICRDLEDEVKETILMDLSDERKNMTQFFNNINMMLIRKLQEDSPHLKDSTTDHNVQIDAFWFLGHSDVSKDLKEFLQISNQNPCDWNTNQPLRARLQPNLVLRTRMPLNQATDLDSSLSSGQEIDFCHFEPKQYGFQLKDRRAVILPGFLPGVVNEHGHTFFYNMDSIDEFQRKYGDAYLGLAHHHRAILAGFSQTFSHAFYQGATPFRDPERPVTQQTVFSNGQLWNFSVYQLNSCNFSFERGTDYTHNNVLWLQQPVQLYEAIEDNKVIGYNSDVMKTLIKMYLKETVDVPTPDGMRYVMNHPASKEFKNEFHRHFRNLMSEAKYMGKKENCIAMWEYIYKIWNDARPQDAKRKFFELPWRRIPDHLKKISDLYPGYINKPNRAHEHIRYRPRLNSESLMKYDYVSVKKVAKHYKDWDLLQTSDGFIKKKQIGDPYLLRDC